MENRKNTAGLILSAGFSSRMKDFKPLMKIGKKNALECLIESFRTAGVSEIIVVVGYNAEIICEFLKGQDVSIVTNEKYADGMFTSVQAGIRYAAAQGYSCVFMTPVDIPMIPPYVIAKTVEEHEAHPGFFVVPCFEDKKGHPLCIPEEYYKEILESDGAMGLKSVTSLHEDRMIRFPTHAEGIVRDMDTPAAYEDMLAFYEKNRFPDEEKCWKILKRMETPSHVIRHCLAVTDTAVAMAEELNRHGRNLSISLIRAAGMLHDVLRIRKKHWEEGAKLALYYGYPEVAEIIEAHMNYIPAVPVYDVDEKDLVCLADKLRQEERLVTLDQRLEPVRQRWKDDPDALAIIEKKIAAADAVLQYVSRSIGRDVYELLREMDQEKAAALEGKPKARRLILVRHGDIQKHKERIFLGQKDIPLNVEGKEQCTHVGLELQHFDVESDIIYCSDLNRAKESAKIIARILGDKFRVVEVPEFREMNLGKWDGMYISDIRSQFPEEYKKRGEDLIHFKIDEEAENFVELQQRVMKKLNALIEETEGDLVIVSHSGVLRCIRCALEGRPLEDLTKMKFDRGTYQILELPQQE
ncbi:MAG: DVU_1551 family NTP transferase [Anaerovoracaceae bacterium]